MTFPSPLRVTACLVAAISAPAPAFASGGWIGFSGRIVEPTCDTSQGTIDALVVGTPPRRVTCALTAIGRTEPAYVASMARLNGDAPDRVLHYFESYVRMLDPVSANPVLLTKVYE